MQVFVHSRVIARAVLFVGMVTFAVLVGPGRAHAATPPLPSADHFVAEVDNPYFPLEPRTTYQFTGFKGGESRRSRFTITPRTKEIMGVTCLVIEDNAATAAGIPIERTWDYFAQDDRGNVWYFGEDSLDYVSGRWVRSDGSWRAGVDGATPGIVMEAHPQPGDTYQQEHYAGHAEDQAKVIGFVETVTVPAGTFHNVLVTEDSTPLRPGDVDRKFYAPGVGFIQGKAVHSDEHSELVNIIEP